MNSDEKIKAMAKVEIYVIGALIVFSAISLFSKFWAFANIILVILVHIAFMWFTGNTFKPTNLNLKPKPDKPSPTINVYPVVQKELNERPPTQWQEFS
jgi:hypothetical protein